MIKTYNPTSAGHRARRALVKEVAKKRPEKSLVTSLVGPAGRSHGTVASRHQQRGSRKFYRFIDFKRAKYNIPGKVVAIEHDPNRGANIALVSYADGEKSYILAPEGLVAGMTVISANGKVELGVGNTGQLAHMPLGMEIHNLEIMPGRGGQMVRGAGNAAVVLAKEGGYVNVKLPSGEVKKFQEECKATLGRVSNVDLRNINLGKAGRNRHLGRRPHVRGVAVASPKQHPHGGSYKDGGIGMPSPKSPWGWKTKGVKTRSRSRTNKFIVTDRRRK